MNRATLLLRAAVAILTFLWAWTLSPPSLHAETETWQIQSTYPYAVQLEFYSKDRNAAWPGGGKAYLLEDSKVHTFSLDCRAGERICYGAWDKGTGRPHWGVGKNESDGCAGCCWTCGRKGAPRTINLTP